MTITDTAVALLDRALDGWRTVGLPDPAIQTVITGEVAIDACCDGVLILGIEQLVWWNPFPFEALGRGGVVTIPFVGAAQTPCMTSTFGAVATLWIGRCVPVLDYTGNAPDPTALSDAMRELTDLTQAIGQFIACDDEERWVVGGADFVGAEGGCLYGRLAIRLDAG